MGPLGPGLPVFVPAACVNAGAIRRAVNASDDRDSRSLSRCTKPTMSHAWKNYHLFSTQHRTTRIATTVSGWVVLPEASMTSSACGTRKLSVS